MKPSGPVFDAAWRKACRVDLCSISDVDCMIQAHYLHKRPAIVLLAMMMSHGNDPVGCVVYSAPPRESNRRYGGETWELSKLYLADPSAGHTGTIYRAANWRQDGMTDDERKSPRCDYVDLRTGKKYGRRGNMPPDAVVVRKPRVSKYRFMLAL